MKWAMLVVSEVATVTFESELTEVSHSRSTPANLVEQRRITAKCAEAPEQGKLSAGGIVR